MVRNVENGMKCVKYMLFISNFIFVMVGILLIMFGSTIKSIYKDFDVFMESYYFSPATLVVVVGVIILLIALFGCAAAIKESTCMVNMYAMFLVLVLVLEVSAAIAAYTMRFNIEVLVERKMEHAMSNYHNNNHHFKDAFDMLQYRLRCCGIHGQEDWFNNTQHTNIVDLPDSCCITEYENGTCAYYSRAGCLDRLVYIISESSIMLGTGAICIALVQILGIIFSCMLAKSIRRLKTERAALRWHTRQELYLQLARGNENKPTPIIYTATGEPMES